MIIIVGENRSFDRAYATDMPKRGAVLDLDSQSIPHADAVAYYIA